MTDTDERSSAGSRVTRLSGWLTEAGPFWASALGTVLLFLFAIQLLGTATEAAQPVIERILRRVVVGNSSALGLSWLTTYALTNGSVVAALSLSLFRSTLTSVSETFLMISGSRLGGAAIVVLVGALDYLQRRHGRTLSEGTGLGLLTFLVTFTIYLPVTVLGLAILKTARSELVAVTGGLELSLRSVAYIEPVTTAVTQTLGPDISFVVSFILLFGSLWLFDRLLQQVETETFRRYVFQHFELRWLAFAIGLLLTGVTTSVAFSLGIIVPLYNREFVHREEIIPYILGANIGTLFDTLLVAVILETTVGVAIVLLILGLATLLTCVVLVGYSPYTVVVGRAQNKLVSDRRFFVGFGVVLIAVPLALLVGPHL
jgi:sodium-dependent phosphate cotransporter